MRHAIRSLTVGLMLCVPSAALPFHFSVVKSTPMKDQKLDASPKRLQVWFSQAPAPVVSVIKLKREAADVELGKTVVDAPEKSMYADPIKPLVNGTYTLIWRAAGDDGHVLSGEVTFSIDAKTR